MSIAAALLLTVAVLLAGAAIRPPPLRRPGDETTPGSDATPARWSVRTLRRQPHASPAAAAEWATDLSRQLRGGQTLRHALTRTEPTDAALRERTAMFRRSLDRGDDLTSALRSLPCADRSETHLALLAAVIGACAQVGGSAAEPLDRAAATLRGRAADQEERAAHSAQGQLSARVMTILPLAALALLAIGDHDVRWVLMSSAGLLCLAMGLALNALGWWWMRRIVGANR